MNAHTETLAADGQAYDGELAMLRGLVRTLRVVIRDNDSVTEVQRLLHQHASDDAAARAEAREKASVPAPTVTPEFFRPGRTYLSPYSHFHCIAVSRHPATRERRVVGWYGPRNQGGAELRDLNPDDHLFGVWTDVTEGSTP